jgi:hypothetical protein
LATRRRRRQGRAVLSRSPETSPRWLHKHAFRRALTVRPHHPRAVEHRDCPPCGGDGVISHGIGRWGWMAPDPAAGFVVSFERAGEIPSRVNPDSAEFGHQALSSSGLTRGSFFLATVEVVVGQQDPRVEPEDDAAGGTGSRPSPGTREQGSRLQTRPRVFHVKRRLDAGALVPYMTAFHPQAAADP